MDVTSHDLEQYMSLNMSNNASSEEELLASEEQCNRLENDACYASYYRLLLRAWLAAMDKPSMPRYGCRRVNTVVTLNAADNRHVSSLTINDMHSLI